MQFLFTSDSHYGLVRPSFRGHTNVSARIVNQALVAAMNVLPATSFPEDGGIGAAGQVGAIDFFVDGGDIANREEIVADTQVQPAARSWAEFEADYVRGLTTTDAQGHRSAVYAVPGNHDVSDAIGFYKPMTPVRDGTALAGLYNLMMAPPVAKTADTIVYPRDRVQMSRDLGGIHFVFVTVWPDSPQRRWIADDLTRVPATTPVVIFSHDQPDVEAKHLINPNGAHDMNPVDKFENLLVDTLADGKAISTETTIEQRDLEALFRAHPNITAYFHGNSNWNEFYDWKGPDHTVDVHTFRVDSPIKGAESATDETRLSFQIATIDTATRTMTVRECLWNKATSEALSISWGAVRTVGLGRGAR